MAIGVTKSTWRSMCGESLKHSNRSASVNIIYTLYQSGQIHFLSLAFPTIAITVNAPHTVTVAES